MSNITDDPRYLKRKIRSGSLDVHPTEKALIVNYELEALILGENGDKMIGEKKNHQKIIRLNCLNLRTDCAALAREVVEKCTLIHPSKVKEIEHLIRYLQTRKENHYEKDSPRAALSASDMNMEPSISSLDAYVENLYEDTYEKILGSAMIRKLAQDANNLEAIALNESALSALSRVLREDWRKNVDLATNILSIFNCFSTYSQFHPVIIQYKIGSLCMEVVDYEIRRFVSQKNSRSSSPKDAKKRQSMIPINKKRSESANRLSSSSDDYRKSLPNTPLNPNKSLLDSLVDSENKKKEDAISKQDGLLRVAVSLLYNIAENIRVEEKMKKKNISAMLIQLLERNSVDLLVLCVNFLKKLSIYKENKDDMIDHKIVDVLAKLLYINHDDLTLACMKLLFNLSFDGRVREQIVKQGLLPRFVTSLSCSARRETALKLLYHMSMEDRAKILFSYTDCVSILMNSILEPKVDPLIVVLSINLALNKENAEKMLENNMLRKFLTKAFKNQDVLIMKLIRNIVSNEGLKKHLVEFIGDIAKAVTQCDSEDFVLECVGILSELTIQELDFCQIFQQFGLLKWLESHLEPGQNEDDLILACVVFLGTAVCDENLAALICKSSLLRTLIELLKAKQVDDEIVLQILYVFYQLTKHDISRNYLIKETEITAYLIDLMLDSNKEIVRVCDLCLDIISEHDEDWKKRIILEKFRMHNSHWLTMVENLAADDLDQNLDDDYPPYLNMDLMQNTKLFKPDDTEDLSNDDDDVDDDDLEDFLLDEKSRFRLSQDLDIELTDDGPNSSFLSD